MGEKHLQGSLRAGKEFAIDPLLASRVIGICVQSFSKTYGAINSHGEKEKYLGQFIDDCVGIKLSGSLLGLCHIGNNIKLK